jgi:hypothetical protein
VRVRHTLIALAGMALLAAPAFAGPTWQFGPENQGLLKLEYKGQFALTVRDTGAEADGEGTTSEFNFRRNRLALMGAYGANFGLYVQTEFTEDVNIGPLTVTDGGQSDFRILDAVMRFKLADSANLWLGKFKYGFTRENLESCEDPLTLDRSLFIRAPFVGTRDNGISLWGNLFDGVVQYRVDAMNGRNDSVSAPKSQFRYSARAHLSLLDPESGYGYKGTYMGTKKVLTIGTAYQMESDVAFSNIAAQTAVDYKAWTVDLFAEYPVEGLGTFTASGAYVDYDLDNAYQGGVNADPLVIGLNGEKNGYYVKAGYMLPNLPLQFFGRYENWSFAQLNGVIDQEIDWFGGGFNYYIRGQNLKLTMELSRTEFDVVTPISEDFTTFTTQLQLVF